MQDPIDIILNHEGGFVNHPADKGGPTKFGVTQKTYSAYLGRPASLQEVKDMDVETAREIFEINYLTGPRIHLIPNPLMTMVLDMSINHGPRNALKMVQRVVNAAGFGPITVDGRLGPKTRAALNATISAMGNMFQNALVEERIRYYHQKVIEDPTQEVFLKGWTNRANSFRLPT